MIGVFPGKFLPLHSGHLTSILSAHTRCDRLYVIVCERPIDDGRQCAADGIAYIDGIQRRKWLKQETQGIEGIEVIHMDEERRGIPSWPDGWKAWAAALRAVVPEEFDVIFGGEREYEEPSRHYLPGIRYELVDPDRRRWNVSASAIRRDPMRYWHALPQATRPFFCRKVLVTGTESCGKTTLTRTLARIYNTSFSEELGRYYSAEYLGGDEGAFTDEDFLRIAHLQSEQDRRAIESANRVCFIDTDAVITNYYAKLYLGHAVDRLESSYRPQEFDAVLVLRPDVEWVDDGLRFAGDPDRRRELHEELMRMYLVHGFEPARIHEISGDYASRLAAALSIVDRLFSS